MNVAGLWVSNRKHQHIYYFITQITDNIYKQIKNNCESQMGDIIGQHQHSGDADSTPYTLALQLSHELVSDTATILK